VQRRRLRRVQREIGHGRLPAAGDHVAHAPSQELADGPARAFALGRFLCFFFPQHVRRSAPVTSASRADARQVSGLKSRMSPVKFKAARLTQT
jgi:hypothetical protein